MTDHTHRPTYLSFINTRRVCRCRHCDKPIKCTNHWLFWLSLLPALPALPVALRTGLNSWPVLLVCWVICAVVQLVVFRFLRFEVDVIAQKDDGKNTLGRR